MVEYCVVKDDNFYTGNKRNIVNQIATFRFDENRSLHVKIKGFDESKFHSYSPNFRYLFIETDAINFIFHQLLVKHGFTIYRKAEF